MKDHRRWARDSDMSSRRCSLTDVSVYVVHGRRCLALRKCDAWSRPLRLRCVLASRLRWSLGSQALALRLARGLRLFVAWQWLATLTDAARVTGVVPEREKMPSGRPPVLGGRAATRDEFVIKHRQTVKRTSTRHPSITNYHIETQS